MSDPYAAAAGFDGSLAGGSTSTMPKYGLPPDNKTYTTNQTEASLAWVRFLELQRKVNSG